MCVVVATIEICLGCWVLLFGGWTTVKGCVLHGVWALGCVRYFRDFVGLALQSFVDFHP
jgi:hypothetical protein